jgi:SNF2 family DNA or RNA helicase
MKTKVIIDTGEILNSIGLVQKVLVVTILNIVDGWGGEGGQLDKHSSRSIWASAIGSKKERLRAIEDINTFSESNPDTLCWVLINAEGLDSVLPELLRSKFDLVVVDESTIIKTRTAGRTKTMVEYFKKAPFKIIMTGNPIPKGADEAFSQYHFVDEGVFGSKYYPHVERYFDVDYFGKVLSVKDPEGFDEELYSIAYRVKKSDCLSLPPKVYQTVYVQMTKEQEKSYQAMYEDAVSSYDDFSCAAPMVITKFLRCSQIAGGFFPGIKQSEDGSVGEMDARPILPNPKLESLVEVVGQLREQKEKIVIWARFRKEIESIQERMLKEGHRSVVYYGGVNYKTKVEAKQKFNTGGADIFIANAQSGARGLNELAGASYVIIYSNDYSAECRQQLEDRTTRPGMNEAISCTYIDMVCRGTIDEDCLAVLQSDKDFAEIILSRRNRRK